MADITPRHRAEKFRRSLNLVERSVPAHLDVHVVLDNSSTLRTPSIQRWSNGTLLHLGQRSAHRSVRDLVASIRI